MFKRSLLGSLLVVLAYAFPAVAQQQAEEKTPGIVHNQSRHSVSVTIDRLESDVKSRGMTVFARIDFAADAEKAGLKLAPKQLLVFGNPKAGTPLMAASPTIAIDLPLKVLAWEDGDGKTWASYNSPGYLKERHGLPDELVKNISGIAALVKKAAGE